MDNRKFSDSAPVSKKKAYKFNIIDFILIIIIVAAVMLLVYVMLGNNILSGGENVTIQYTIEVPLIRNEFISSVHLITKGTKIIDSVRSYDIGEIQDVKVTDAYTNTTDLETGVVYNKPYPDHSKVTITVIAKCKMDKDKFVVNGKTIMVGVKLDFRTPHLVSYGNCTSIEIINADGSKKSDEIIEADDESLDIE